MCVQYQEWLCDVETELHTMYGAAIEMLLDFPYEMCFRAGAKPKSVARLAIIRDTVKWEKARDA